MNKASLIAIIALSLALQGASAFSAFAQSNPYVTPTTGNPALGGAGGYLVPAMTGVSNATYKPLVTLPGVTTKDVPTNPIEMIKGFYGLAIGIGSVIAVAMIIVAGFKYMYQESLSGKSGAKEQITNAFIGLIVILASYIILRTINADLVNFNLNLPGGTGRLTGLIAIQRQNDADFNAATAKIRDAQRTNAALAAEITSLDQQIAALRASVGTSTSTTSSAALELQAAELKKAQAVAKRDYVKADALYDHSLATITNYLSSPDTGTRINVDTYINNTNAAFNEARSSLDALYAKTKDPAVEKQILEIDNKKYAFNIETTQLRIVQEYQNADGTFRSTFKDKDEPVERVKRATTLGAQTLREAGAPDLAKRLEDRTAAKVKLICPSCN